MESPAPHSAEAQGLDREGGAGTNRDVQELCFSNVRPGRQASVVMNISDVCASP